MVCPKCGSPLTENDQFCKSCGNTVGAAPAPAGAAPVQPAAPQPAAEQPVIQQVKPVKQSSNGILYAIIGVLVVIVLCLGVFTVMGGMKKGAEVPATPVDEVHSYKVSFSGYTFSIPDELLYDIDVNYLYVGDSGETWVSQMKVMEGQFEKLKANMDQLASVFNHDGYTAKAAELKKFGNNEAIVVEVSKAGETVVVNYCKLDSMNLSAFVTQTHSGQPDYDVVGKLASISATAVKGTDSNSMKADNNLGVEKVKDLAK